MSDDVLSVIPTDPYWRPDRAAADRTAALVAELAPAGDETEVTWYDTLGVVDCGQNLERIGCPSCGGTIDTEWWADLLDAHGEDGFATLATTVPCCGTRTTLDALDHDWPCGFARFEIAVWNPERGWFSGEELALLGEALGHEVRQVLAHV